VQAQSTRSDHFLCPATAEKSEKEGSPRPQPQLIQQLAAEMLGTFLLTFVDAGGAMIASISGDITPAARAVAAGLLIMAMIYTLSEISGAHLNPAVTFAFALRRAFPWARVPAYWLAEITGALLAALLLRSLFGNIARTGMTLPHHGVWPALVFETLLTFLLVSVILGTATQKAVVGKNGALAVGGTVALCALFSRPISGASMNPARSLGPAIVGGSMPIAWIYVVAPLIGAVLAVAVCRILHGHERQSETKAAMGGGEERN
jgi:MIP family channel proteins